MFGKKRRSRGREKVGECAELYFLKTAIFLHAPGVTGYLKMDSNGDRETDFSLWDMHPETGTFRVRLYPRRQCQPVMTSCPPAFPRSPARASLLCSHPYRAWSLLESPG